VGQTCSQLSRLCIGGNEVTDRGLLWMCGGQPVDDDLTCPVRFLDEYLPGRGPTPLCHSLTHLSIAGCLGVSEKGVELAWTSLPHLIHYHIQESHLWIILNSIESTGSHSTHSLPLRRLELTVSSRHDYLTTATKVFPKLEELILWNFDSENVAPFTRFQSWSQFRQLSSLRLNNVPSQELGNILTQLSGRLTLLDVDNFSGDDDCSSSMDLALLSVLCPRLHTLSVTMAHLTLLPTQLPGYSPCSHVWTYSH